MIQKIWLCLWGICWALTATGQANIPTGEWRTHFTYHNARSVAVADDRIYCASDNGLFYQDRADGSLGILTKLNGLSSNSIIEIGWHQSLRTLVILYANGNIDLLESNGRVRTIADIRLAPFPAKQMYRLTLWQNTAYISTSFGLVVADLLRREVRETYSSIGPGGSQLAVYAAAVVGDSLMLATPQGVMLASNAPGVVREDFNNWRTLNLPTLFRPLIRHVTAAGSNGYFAVRGDSVYEYSQGRWRGLVPGARQNHLGLSGGERLHILLENNIWQYVPATRETILLRGNRVVLPQAAIRLSDGTVWAADRQTGLVRVRTDNNASFFPQGPLDQRTFRIYHHEGRIIALSGGYDASTNPEDNDGGIFVWQEGAWVNYSARPNFTGAVPLPFPMEDPVALAANGSTLFIGSYQQGLITWDTRTNAFNSFSGPPLSSAGNNQVRVAGLAVDAQGVLWLTNPGSAPGVPKLLRRTLQGSWSAMPYDIGTPLDLLIDSRNNKWVRLAGSSGVFVFRDETRSRQLTSAGGNGNLRSNDVLSMAVDLDGVVLIGTSQGITQFFPSANLFGTGLIDGPALRDNSGAVVLLGERINAIAVDGANRKWIGTDNGLWLFDPREGTITANFNSRNSPLPTDRIRALCLHPVTGELFISTDGGLLSYRTGATAAAESHGDVTIFPNPVRPDFEGLVTISGLARNATVKITDVSGKLFYETRAYGGTATWNRRTYTGEEAKTGVYLVFSASEDGQSNFVGKIAVIE